MLNVFIYLCLWWITRCAEGIFFFFFYSRRLVRRWGGEREGEEGVGWRYSRVEGIGV